MASALTCWKCGGSLDRLPQPLARRAQCPSCQADLHVCRMCRHFDTGKAKQCREPVAEPVQDKTRANFCEWFQPRQSACTPTSGPDQKGRQALDALFSTGTDAPEADSPRDSRAALEQLFKR